MGQLIQELKRRNVIRVGIAYAVAAWVLIEVTATIFPILSLPQWSVTLVTALLFIGFPIALIFAWAFEITPEGIKLEKHVVRDESITHHTGRKLDFVIIAMLVVALGYLGYDKFIIDPDRDAVEIEAAVQVVQEQAASAVEPQDSAKTIAVLPFANMSDDPGNDYFADGISEDILNLLAQVPDLLVISRSSAFSFKGQNLDVPTIAAKLNVTHVLEGSVRKSGNQLRIVVQLIEVETDTHLWSKTFDRELKDVFAIQDEIAGDVVDALKIILLGDKPKAAETDPEAYALYLQGRHFLFQWNEESDKRAEILLKQALEIDPGYAPAWVDLGLVYFWRAAENVEDVELARNAIQRALAADSQYGLAHALLARIEMEIDWDITAAYQHQQQALALAPGDAIVLRWAGRMEFILGRIDEAIDLTQRSIALDPVSSPGYLNLGYILYSAHRLEEAADFYKDGESLNPASDWSHYLAGLVLLAQGDARSALVMMEQEINNALRLTGIAIVQHALGDAEASDAALQALIECCAAGAAIQVAIVYAFRAEVDYAFDWVDQAYDNRGSRLPTYLRDPLFANLHDDPRWTALLDKMGLPH